MEKNGEIEAWMDEKKSGGAAQGREKEKRGKKNRIGKKGRRGKEGRREREREIEEAKVD